MKRVIKLTVSVLILAFLTLSPPWLLQGLNRNAYRAFLEKPAVEWHGRIELWHIAGFRVYQGSVTDYLQERADRYCKKHYGVHIDVVGMTLAQYNDRIARGDFPDAYSFPAGSIYPERLRALPLEQQRFRNGLSFARQGKSVLAVPYLMSGYFLAANTQLLTGYGLTMPESADVTFLQAALDLNADTPQLAMPVIHAARLGLRGTLAETDAFTGGKCMLSVLDARALGDILRGEKGTMLIDAIPFPGYTDETLYLGGAAEASAEQMAALADFAAFLLTEQEQLRLTSLGALPVIETEEKPAYADELLERLQEESKQVVIPQPFLYERHHAMLAEEAAAALSGDAGAKAAFFERLAVVENGNL